MPKTKRPRSIDKAPRNKAGDAPETATLAVDFAPPAQPKPLAPTNLQLTTTVEFSTASPSAIVSATWDPPPGVQPRSYVAQISESNTFPAAGTLTLYTRADQESVDFGGRRPGVTQYVRVAAVTQTQGDWSSTVSIAAAQDTTPSAQPTSLAGTWIGTGDLEVTFTPPTSSNYKDTELKIYASNGGTLLRTVYVRVGPWTYTAAMNLADTAGAGDPSLYIEARSRTFNNIINNTGVPTLTTTKSAPSAPTVAHSWTGDTGLAGADLTFTLTLGSDVAKCRLSLNAQTARDIYGTVYTYTYARNVADNGSPGDPSLAYSITAVDGLGQASTATAGTATNAVPAAPVATLTQGAVSGIRAEVTSTPPADHWRFEFVFKRDGTTVATIYSAGAVVDYPMLGASDGGFHSWTVVVRQQDLFAQFSATHTPSAVAFEGLTLAYLREGIEYGDSLGTASATLKAAFADGVVDSGGVSYNA